MRLLAALLGLLFLMPAAHAQVGADPCGPFTLTHTVPAGPLAPGQTGEVAVTVRNEGSLPASVTAALRLEPEAGWTYAKEGGPAKSVPAGESATFRFTATPSEGAGETAGTVSVTANCQAPVGGLACGEAACTKVGTTSFRLGYRAEEGLSIPFLQSLSFPPEYLIASLVLVGLVAAIALLARRPARRLAADCPEPLKVVRAGRGASFPIEIRNGGGEPATARLEVGAVPEGWSAFMPLPDVQLAPRETRSIFLMVRAPEDAIDGDAADVEVAVRSAAAPEKTSYVRVRAEVEETPPPA